MWNTSVNLILLNKSKIVSVDDGSLSLSEKQSDSLLSDTKF